MKLTVGRVIHYYDGQGQGPWMAWVVAIDPNEFYVVPPLGMGLGPYRTFKVQERLPEEAEAQRNNDISFWCWPPKV